MNQTADLPTKLIHLLREHLSPEDVQLIADGYGERCGIEKSLYDQLVVRAGAEHIHKMLVLYAGNRRDLMGLADVVTEYRPDLQHIIRSSGFELRSLIRAYLALLSRELNVSEDVVIAPSTLRYVIRHANALNEKDREHDISQASHLKPDSGSAARWVEVSFEEFLSNHAHFTLLSVTDTAASITLRRLVKSMAAAWQASDIDTPFPVFASLGKWFNPRMNLLQFLQSQMTWCGVPQLSERLPDLVKAGQIVLLLDGLEQLPNSRQNQSVGLPDDLRLDSIASLSQDAAWSKVKCVLSSSDKNFVIGPGWHNLYALADHTHERIIDPAYTLEQLLRTQIRSAIDSAITSGRMTDSEASELQTRLSYLAINMIHSRRTGTQEEQQAVDINMACGWLFRLIETHEGDQGIQRQSEANPVERQQALRLLQLGEDAGLLTTTQNSVRFTHRHIHHYLCVSYCLAQSLDDARFLAWVSRSSPREVWWLWSEFDPLLTDKVLDLLSNAGDSAVRSNAALALSRLDNSRAIGPLLSALTDKSPRVRSSAAFALGHFRSSHAVDGLTLALQDKDTGVRSQAVLSLKSLDASRAVEPVINALKDRDREVRRSAALVLSELQDVRAIEPLIAALAGDDFALRIYAGKALATYGEAAVARLMGALADAKNDRSNSLHSNAALSYAAAEILGEIGDVRPLPALLWMTENDGRETQEGQKVRQVAAEAVKNIYKRHQSPAILAAWLRNSNRALCLGAAFALGNLADNRAVGPLVEALQHADERVRWGAARLLGSISDNRAINPLIAALGDVDSKVSDSAGDALLNYGGSAVLPLIAATQDANAQVRTMAASVLGNIHSPQAVKPLIAALKDENSEIRRQAVVALGKLGSKQALEPLAAAVRDADKYVRIAVPDAVYTLSPDRAIEILIDALKDEDEYVRYLSASGLVKYGDNRAVLPLIAALKDKFSLVREYAAYALGKYGDGRAVEQLIANLQDESGLAAMAAATALGNIGDERAIEPLVARLPDRNLQYCTYVAEALEKFGDHVIPALLAALKDEGPDAVYSSEELYFGKVYYGMAVDLVKSAHLRYSAAEILGKVGDVRALPVLMWMASNDKNEMDHGRWKVQDVTAKAIESIRRRYQDTARLVAALQDQDSLMRVGAAFALGKLGHERAIEGLTLALTDADRRVRWGAAGLLEEIKGNRRPDS